MLSFWFSFVVKKQNSPFNFYVCPTVFELLFNKVIWSCCAFVFCSQPAMNLYCQFPNFQASNLNFTAPLMDKNSPPMPLSHCNGIISIMVQPNFYFASNQRGQGKINQHWSTEAFLHPLAHHTWLQSLRYLLQFLKFNNELCQLWVLNF